MLKKIIRKLILRHKADSESYIAYLKREGAQIGDNVRIFTPAHTNIDNQALFMLKIGSNVVITGPVTILTHDYSSFVCARVYPNRERAIASMRPVTIGDNVFIGWGTTILPGTVIGNNTIIGAGSVVSGFLAPNSVYAGNPAKKLMSIDEFYDKRIKKQEKEAKVIFAYYYHRYKREPIEKIFYGYESLWNTSKYSICRYDSFLEFCNSAKESIGDII